MLKKMTWNAFKKTGSVDLFLELKAIEGLEQKLAQNQMKEETAEEFIKKDIKVKKDGTNQNQGNGNCGK